MVRCFYPVQTSKGPRPCGQCAACLVQKHLQWKFRLEKEVLSSDVAYWVTLQYDDEHLPRSNGVPCVSKLHCQNYFRQIRKSLLNSGIKVTFKYFLTSEYGPQTNRPHYHALLLCKLPETSFKSMLALRQRLYELFKERWYHGHCEEKLFHRGVITYLSKYVFKPQADFDPPVKNFRLISKGIGESYLDQCNLDDLLRSAWKTPSGVLPRYYRDKLLPVAPPSYPGRENTENYLLREQVNEVVRDSQYKRSKNEFQKCNCSIEEFEKRQRYLLRSQRSLCERKQKLKYG